MKPLLCLILLAALFAPITSAHAYPLFPRKLVPPIVSDKAFDAPVLPASWKAALTLASVRREIQSCITFGNNTKISQSWQDPLCPAALSPFDALRFSQKQPAMKNASRYAAIPSRTPDGYHVGPPF